MAARGSNIAGLIILLISGGCVTWRTGNVNVPERDRPKVDWHIYTGEPVKGALPWILSGGEEHHSYDSTHSYQKGIPIIDYPLGKR